MTYFAMARRWRPQTFSEVAAQKHITETLQRAVDSGRVAAAYLFSGPRGSGKTTAARILAKAVNCDQPQAGEPCGKCEFCKNITEQRALDVIEIDGASNNSVDDVRELRENVRYAPTVPGKRKVYIIDEVHMLSAGAFNALLKTLEEPPPHVLFIFATTEIRKVPATIQSRCQRFDFRQLLTAEVLERLRFIAQEEKLDLDDGALFLLARRAEGSLRDALSLLDQVISSSSGHIGESQVADVLGLVPEESYFELAEAILARDSARGLAVLHASLRSGADAGNFVLGLLEMQRNLLLLAVDPALEPHVQLGEAHVARARELAGRFRSEDLLYLLNRSAALYEEVRRSSQPQLLAEAAVVEMTRFESRVDLSQLLATLEGGAAPAPRATPTPPGATAGKPAASPPKTPPARRSTPRAEAAAAPRAEASDRGAVGVATASPPIAAGGPMPQAARLDLEAVQSRWLDLTSALRSTKAMLAHCLAEGRPVRLEGGTLEVWFPPEHSFHVHLFEESLKKRELDPYVSTYFGQSLKVVLAPESPGEGAPAAGPRLTPDDIATSRRGAIEDVVQSTPGLEAIIDAFDGEVLDEGDA